MGIKIKFPESGEGRHKKQNIYAHLYCDHKRIVDEYRCDLYVRIITDHGEFLECELVGETEATFYISKDVIAIARIEDKI